MQSRPLAVVLALAIGCPTQAAELQPRTIAAFDRYVRATDLRMAGELETAGPFLFIDAWPEAALRTSLEALKQGRVIVERLRTNEGGRDIAIPGGLVHHWVGLVFVPGATVDRAVAMMQDYDRHAELFRPALLHSQLRARDGPDRFSVFLRFHMKKIIAVTVNTDNDARFTRLPDGRVDSRIVSTRVAEVESAGTAQEREKPVGRDGGFMWRLNSYWRFVARDGGTYIQCESISLSRGIPLAFGWLIGPFVKSIPRESLTFILEKARSALVSAPPAAAASTAR